VTGTLTPRISRVTWRTPALIALIAVVVRLPTYLSTRPLSFDDGVYGASARAMRDVCEAAGRDGRLIVTAIQTVGLKDYDGFLIARVR